MKKKSSVNFILVMMLIIGLSLLLYPSVSNYWNSFTQSRAISSYSDTVAKMQNEEYVMELEKAQAYNRKLTGRLNPYLLSDELRAEYDTLLNITGSGVMGYIEVPRVGIMLPIYHGTNESILQVAAGHLDWSSLPTGGESTHCVISGHRGLPSARLFTDLDKIEVGDVFMVHVLDELLTYEVDQIVIVEPQDTEELLIQEGKDLFTLVTCTPYAVNTHRILVRGHRIENAEVAPVIRVTADAIQVEPMVVAVFLITPILMILLTVALVFDKIWNRDNS